MRDKSARLQLRSPCCHAIRKGTRCYPNVQSMMSCYDFTTKLEYIKVIFSRTLGNCQLWRAGARARILDPVKTLLFMKLIANGYSKQMQSNIKWFVTLRIF